MDSNGTIDKWFLDELMVPSPIGSEDPTPPLDSILLYPLGYISPRENDTTAEGRMRDGHTRVSCFTIYCPGLPDHEFNALPRIITSEADLVLLRIAICRRGDHWKPRNNDYFVYKAGIKSKVPSLDLVPSHPVPEFADTEIALLRCRSRNMYFVSTLRKWPLFIFSAEYDLQLYNSKQRRWRSKVMLFDLRDLSIGLAGVATTLVTCI